MATTMKLEMTMTTKMTIALIMMMMMAMMMMMMIMMRKENIAHFHSTAERKRVDRSTTHCPCKTQLFV